MMLARLSRTIAQRARPLTARTFAAPAPKMFDYDTIVKSLSVADAIETVEVDSQSSFTEVGVCVDEVLQESSLALFQERQRMP